MAGRPGRKRKLTADKKRRLVELLEDGATLAIAGSHRDIDIHRSNIYREMERDAAFAEAVDEARSVADDVVESRLYREAVGGNVTACIFWLKNRRPHEWRDRHDVAVEDGSSIRVVVERVGIEETGT